MKSLIAFLRVLLSELGSRCGTSTIRDWKTVSERYEHEGFSFFTITLSNFGKDFEKSLDQQFVGPDQFLGFSRTGSLPRFLGGFFDLVFDRKTGRLLDCPSIDAIYAIRQFSLMCGKVALDCTDRRVQAAIDGYVKCEQEVKASDAALSADRKDAFIRISRLLWADLFSEITNTLWKEGVQPRHGPGATADRLRGNAKYNQLEWTQRLEREFPAWNFLIPSYNFLEKLDAVRFLEPGEERPVRVITVPKTQKTPRIIAVEPTCMQYVQQGILELMVQKFRENDHARNFVLFDSQEPNRLMARAASRDGSLATLDLSEASDRVSYQHVRYLLSDFRLLRDSVDACRSRKADVPGYGVLRLAKFASMGSALCFPFEALVFATIVFVGIEQSLNRQLTKRDVKSFFGQVRVYGDDIIIPVDHVPAVLNSLADFGMRVNTGKSFWTGKFRESCGGDFYDGYDVKVVRLRRMFPTARKDVAEVVSTVSLRNHLYENGFEDSVAFLDDLISRIIPFPEIESLESPLLGRLTYSPVYGERFDLNLHVPLVRGMRVVPRLPVSPLEDSGALMKFFLKRGETPFEDTEHLQRSGRPVSVSIKSGWAPPY